MSLIRPTAPFPGPASYATPNLTPNPSSDSNSSDSSCASGPAPITPRGSLSTTAPIHISQYTDSSPPGLIPDMQMGIRSDMGKEEVLTTKTSRRTLKPKTSFSGWTNSFRSSAIMQFRTSQEGRESRDVDTPEKASQIEEYRHIPSIDSGQFDDAQSSPNPNSRPPSSSGISKTNSATPRSSSPMRPNSSVESSTSQSSFDSRRGSTRKLVSGLKKLGVTLRPGSFDRKGILRVPSSGTATHPIPPSLADAPIPLRVSYTLASAAAGRTNGISGVGGGGVGGAPISFAAFLPPERLEWHERRKKKEEESKATLRLSRASGIRTDIEGLAHDTCDTELEKTGKGEDRGLFSPPPPESPVMSGIQGALGHISPMNLPASRSAINQTLTTIDTSCAPRQAYPTPILPPTSCPSPNLGQSPCTSPLEPDPKPNDPIQRGVGAGTRSAPASRLFTPFESSISREVGLSLPASTSTNQPSSALSRTSTSNRGSTANRGRCVSFTSQNHPSNGIATARNSPTGSPRHSATGLPTSHSAQNLSYHFGPLSLSNLSRHSSLRRPGNSPRGSPTSYNPPFTLIRQTSRTSLRQWAQPSPIPPSLIITPKTLEPPVNAVSPVVGACPIEPNPVSDGREPEVRLGGRPRTKSGKWRSPTGLFELGGLGLGDLRAGSSGSKTATGREGQKGESEEKYEHVDTPGEFGLGGTEKVKQAEKNGENPYFA